MSRILVKMWLYNKRLLKKPSFVCVLACCVLLVFIFSLSVADDGAILKIAVASEGDSSELYSDILTALERGGLIGIVRLDAVCALEALDGGEVDAAWIFPADLKQRIEKYASDVNEENFVVSVYQREESVLLQISREKLMSALYPYVSNALYNEFMGLRYPQIAASGEEVLDRYYDSAEVDGEELFRVVTKDGESVSTETGVLLSPVRGILAVLVLVGGLAVSLFTIRDEKNGAFNLIPERKRFRVYVLYNFIAVLDISVVSLMALCVSGLSVSFGREIIIMLMLVVSAVGFSTLMRVLLPNEALFGAVIPIISILLITLCPIFINVNIPLWFRLLLPPYGYLAGAYSLSLMLPWLFVSCAFYLVAYAAFVLRLKVSFKA